MNKNTLHIPKETDADVAMAVISSNVKKDTGELPLCLYEFKGVAERTALGDVLTTSVKNKNGRTKLEFSLKRDSLYHILPEYLFHPLDRFLGTEGDTEEFEKRFKEQEEQKRNALLYFKPFDTRYQDTKILYQQWLNDHVFSGNLFISDYITEGYPYNKDNPFINAVIPCLPWIRSYRGNHGMVTTSLLYAFRGNVKIELVEKESSVKLTDDVHFTLDRSIDDLYCGEECTVLHKIWTVRYQTHLPSEGFLLKLQKQVREFSVFFKDWFISIEDMLELSFGDCEAPPLLYSQTSEAGIFLNYSTQLI